MRSQMLPVLLRRLLITERGVINERNGGKFKQLEQKAKFRGMVYLMTDASCILEKKQEWKKQKQSKVQRKKRVQKNDGGSIAP